MDIIAGLNTLLNLFFYAVIIGALVSALGGWLFKAAPSFIAGSLFIAFLGMVVFHMVPDIAAS